jgi:hypothetical protein
MKPLGFVPQLSSSFRGPNSRTANYETKGLLILMLRVISLLALATSAIAQAALSPATLSFGNQVVGVTSAAQIATFKNTQTSPITISGIVIAGESGPGDYTGGGSCPLSPNTLGAGLSCSINVTFNPTGLGTRTGALTVTDSASNSPQSIALTGVGIDPVTTSPGTLTFPHQFVGGGSGSQTVTIQNAQNVPLKIISIATLGGTAPGDFRLGGLCPLSPNTLGPGLSCSINVRFQPSAPGTRTSILTVTDSASNSPQSVALTGMAVAAVTDSPTTLTFASQVVGTTSAAMTVTLTNHLSSALNFSSVSANGDFVVASNTCGSAIGAGVQCKFGVTFTPTVVGARTGTLSIYDSAPGSPSLVTLNGTGGDGQTWGKIQHVVIVFQENRTPDNLFRDPVLMARGADIASSGLNSSGDTIALTATWVELQH